MMITLAFFKYLYRPCSTSPAFTEEGPETKVNDLVNDMHLVPMGVAIKGTLRELGHFLK